MSAAPHMHVCTICARGFETERGMETHNTKHSSGNEVTVSDSIRKVGLVPYEGKYVTAKEHLDTHSIGIEIVICGNRLSQILQELLRNLDESRFTCAVGFDVEWKPNFKSGQPNNPVAVIQIAFPEYVLVVCRSAWYFNRRYKNKHIDPRTQAQATQNGKQALAHLLADERILKVGVGIVQDLETIFSDKFLKLPSASVCDVNKLIECTKPLSLTKLVFGLAGVLLDKTKSVTMSNWERRLNERQTYYAAADAYFSRLVFEKILQSKSIAAEEKTELNLHELASEMGEELHLCEVNDLAIADRKAKHAKRKRKVRAEAKARKKVATDRRKQQEVDKLKRANLSTLEKTAML